MMSAAMKTTFQTDACFSDVKPDADTARQYRILLAEDDKEMRTLLALALKRSGYEVVACPDGADMLTHLAAFLMPCDQVHESFDLIISDIRMPGCHRHGGPSRQTRTSGFSPDDTDHRFRRRRDPCPGRTIRRRGHVR
jgi:hypothetical protein